MTKRSMIQGPNNPAMIGGYSAGQLLSEGARLANNLEIDGIEYTAGIMRRLVELAGAGK